MNIHISYEQSRVPVTVLRIDGAIDSSNYQELDQLAASSIDQGTRYLLLDLSAVRFMSSAALRSLQKIDRKLNALADQINEAAVQKGLLDGTYKSPFLKLVNPTEPVLLTLKTAGWDMIFDIFKDKKLAVGSF